LDIIFLETAHPNFWDISHNNVLRRLSQSIPDKLWDKLIRREVLVNDNIQFTTGIWESADFSMKLYLHAKTYGSIDFPYYYKPMSPADKDFNKIILTLSKWTGPAESVYEEHSQIIHHWMAAMYCDLLIPMYSQLSSEDRSVYKPGIKDFQWLLDIHKTRRNQAIKILYTIFGSLAVSYIVSVYVKSKEADFPNKLTSKISSDKIKGIWHGFKERTALYLAKLP
ncbi:MAG: hypothetical protein FWE30_08530, partial [Bacteroidales bacterium]|nr:hypothetical protein [Bacteroidales bacterium]